MQAMIFAAGLGTRLKPITDTMPKALISVGGEPLLKRVILGLKQAGFDRIIINIHHFADQIVAYLEKNKNFGVDIHLSDETLQLLETGGGIKHAQKLFDTSKPILIHNVDILSNVDLGKFYNMGLANDALLLVSKRPTKRYLLFDDTMKLVGWTNIETKEVKSPYPNLDVSRCKMFAFSGIHLFSPKLFPLMDVFSDKFGIIDFYLKVCADIEIKGYVKEDLRLMDVGKQETLAEANEFIKNIK